MKLGLRYGHSVNCKGATGFIDEVETCKKLYEIIERKCKNMSLDIVNCNSNGNSANSELKEGTDKANNSNIDLFISLHLNSFSSQSANGVEAWTYRNNGLAFDVANKIVNSLNGIGLYKRGVKTNPNYYEMKNVKAPNIILEIGFCSNQFDSNLITSKLDEIANRIIENVFGIKVNEEIKPTKYYRVCVGSYTDINNARAKAKEVGGFIHEC